MTYLVVTITRGIDKLCKANYIKVNQHIRNNTEWWAVLP